MTICMLLGTDGKYCNREEEGEVSFHISESVMWDTAAMGHFSFHTQSFGTPLEPPSSSSAHTAPRVAATGKLGTTSSPSLGQSQGDGHTTAPP